MARDIYPGLTKVEDYVIGDLVVYTGYLLSPDYLYVEQYDYTSLKVGIVLEAFSDEYYNDKLYRVYWLGIGKTTTTISSHLKLAYVAK
tara:strand:- start:1257 stop:1520 length:264 start_codon:yes stop_codon:yes gene_type:complete